MNRTVKNRGVCGQAFLFSPPPPPSTFFFCFRYNFRAITRLETLATQASDSSACIKPSLVRRPLCHKVNLPSCVARRPLYHKVNLPICVARQPLCHKVNLPRYEARQRYLTMTFDIFGTGQMNTLTLCYLLGKTYKPLSSH